MLAKEIKIKNLKKQREFIKEQLGSDFRDGNMSYSYIGEVFPENVAYFTKEGYIVRKLESDLVLAATIGMPIYHFSARRDIELTQEELEQAESYTGNKNDKKTEEEQRMAEVMDMLRR